MKNIVMLLALCFGLLVCSTKVTTQDPCDTSHPLVPNLSTRTPSQQVIQDNDNHLTEKYYSAGNVFDMAMSMEPGRTACGSLTQCWMDDTIPTPTEGEVDKTICCSSLFESENCFVTFDIKVTNCGDYRLYFLRGLGPLASSGRYCFAIQSASNDPAPDFVPFNVQIIPQMIQIEQGRPNNQLRQQETQTVYIPILIFVCDFIEKNGLFYTVFFYVNGKFISDHIKTVDTSENAFLLESELPPDANKMGINIYCEVGAMSTMEGQVGAMIKSPEFFAGLKIESEKHVSLPRGGDHTILVKPTVPIGCKTTTQEPNKQCVAVTVLIRGEKSYSHLDCNRVNIANHHKCALELQGGIRAKWDTHYDFSISTIDDDQTSYDLNDKTYLFQLRTSHSEHDFWNGRSESVTVTVFDDSDTNLWKGKSCSIVCDPHMKTFDSQYYELQKTGVYTAFKHAELPIQVQVKSSLCKGSAYPSAHCICGFAVIVGKSYQILDLCDQTQKRVSYICGKHDELQVIPRDNVFEFRVPTGLKITVTRRFTNFWDIYFYPTVMEVSNTAGLCGSLDNNRCNDFTHRDGSMPINACTKPRWFHPNAFTDSWKLSDDESMFQDDSEVDKLVANFPDYPDSQKLCFCPYNDIEKNKVDTLESNEIVQQAVCGYRKYASCSKNEDSSCQKRYLSLRRRRRSTFAKRTVEDYTNDQSDVRMQKRSTLSETEAREFCEAKMSQNPLRSQCQEMNVDNSDTEIENCVMDIMATGDTEWAGPASDRASQVCLTEVKKNATIQESFPESASLVLNLTCPNNCSNNGFCENGECLCSEGFSAADCSLDLTVSPSVDGLNLGPEPICDVIDDCFEVYVNGGDFPSNRTYICRYSMFHVDNNGSRAFAGHSEVPGRQRNIFQVTCPLAYADRDENVFVLEYELFLKMDDKPFSSGLPFIVMDSTCQVYVESSGKFSYTTEPGYCFINGTCYKEGDTKANNTCKRCVSSTSPYAWTTASDVNECTTVVESDPESTTSTSGNVSLIVATAILSVLCVAAIIVTLLVKFKWAPNIPNSNNSDSHQTLSNHPKSSKATEWLQSTSSEPSSSQRPTKTDS